MTTQLIAEEGHLKGLTIPLDEGEEWTLGRDPEESQVVLQDPSCSRKHLLLKKTSEGLIAENLSETNPVLLNDHPLEAPTPLQKGNTLTIGETVFRLVEKEDEEAEESTEPRQTIFEETTDEDKGILAEIDFDLTETGRYLLKVIHGPNTGAEFSMQKGTTYILGTDPASCDVVFHDTSVSRQHARLIVNDDDTLSVEDLSSKNGTVVDNQRITAKATLTPNILVTLGTTSFIIYDREGEMHTIISPILPQIVKSLQKEEEKEVEEKPPTAQEVQEQKEEKEEKTQTALGAFIVTGILLGLFVLVGIGITTLFQQKPVEEQTKYNITQELDKALAPFPSVTKSFNKTTGRLLLVGHVLTASDRSQLLYNLQGLPFIQSVDSSGIVIDEYAWKEVNQILAKNPEWKGVSIYAQKPGQFILTGSLKTRKDANDLNTYISSVFPYPDLLKKEIIVEEDIVLQVQNSLAGAGIRNIDIKFNNGELTLTGGVSDKKVKEFDAIVANFEKIPGIRGVKKVITEIGPEASLVNITNKYKVSGVSKQGGNVNVVINGRILTKGDVLDGMTITEIKNNYIMLEKDGIQYRIDYSQ
jgi:type III secretion system YscD/HrpQ family protein